jgi:hypothetical protein
MNYSPLLFLNDFVWNSHADPREGGLGGQVSGWQAEDAEFHHYELQSSLFPERFLFETATLTHEKAASEAKFMADKGRMWNFTIMNYSPLLFLDDFVWNSHADPREGGLGGQVSGWQAEDAEFHHYELHSSLFPERFLFGTVTLTKEKVVSEAKFLADKGRMQNFTIMNYSPRLILKDFCLEQPRWPKRRRPRRPSFWLTSGGCGRSGRSSLLRSTASSLQRRPPGEDRQ